MNWKQDLFQTLSKDLVEEERQFIASSSFVVRQRLLEEFVKKALESNGKTLDQQDTLVKSKLRDRGLKLQEKSTKGRQQHSKKPKRRKQQRLTMKVLKRNNLFAISKRERSFQAFIPLHWLWLEYARQVLVNSDILTSREKLNCSQLHSQVSMEWLYRMDFHGAILTVVRSKAPQHVGCWGIVLKETSNVFEMIRKDNTLVAIPKNISDFGCRIDNFCFILHGSAYRVKSSERSVKKLKRRSVD